MKRSLNAYKKVSVDSQLASASSHKMVLMLLNGAMERLIQSRVAMVNKDVAVKGERIGKALDIILNLKASLSMEDGGDIAQNLDGLYGYMIKQISVANKDNSPELITECIDILREITSAWEQIPAEYHHMATPEK